MTTPERIAQLEAIEAAARKVRHLQKVYFGTRTKTALDDAKLAERKLDRLLGEKKAQSEQSTLGF